METRKTTPAAALAACLALVALLLAAAPAGAGTKSRFTIRGAGFGHGVGMSQYGAYGLAQKGRDYRQILAHYYTDTAIGTQPSTTVRVLLQPSVAVARFSGARSAAGRQLDPGKTYGVRRGRTAGTVELLGPAGKQLKRVAAPLVAVGSGGTIRLAGRAGNGVSDGFYRDTLEFSPSGIMGVQAVNAVDLESYVRGVVARESPASWPAEALKAQAVAARTYAVTTSKGGAGWDQYPDTRSQVYGGVSAETPTTDAAVAATASEVVTYNGRPVVTYFFSTSGGKTENVENTSLGNEPLPWLKSVKDPYDNTSPKHRWGPYRWTLGTAGSKLRGLVKGSFRGIEVRKRGRSPRVVTADIVGTRGRTTVTGATLRARLGLFDTWAYFTTITTGKAPKPAPDDKQPPASTGGGATAEASVARRIRHRLVGQVLPARRGGAVTIQRRQGRRWVKVGLASTGAAGRYAFSAQQPGTYRVRYRQAIGPSVRVP